MPIQLKRTRINLAMILRFVYISIVLVVLSGCGNSSSNEVSAKEKIERYAQRGGDMPQVKDYMNVGISEVNSDNLDAVNNILLNLPSGEVKTIVEVKEVLDDFLHNAVSPSITLNGDQSMVLTQYTLYIELGAQANDDLDGNITNNIQIKGTVNTDKVGTYILTYSVRDTAGNETNMTRNVEVVLSEDTAMPVITLRGTNPTIVIKDSEYIEYGATANDNKDGNITSKIVITGTVNTDKVGTYILTYSVRDTAGNETNMTRNVEVVLSEDTAIPVRVFSLKDNWEISYDNTKKKEAKISNKFDEEKQREVVFLDGNERDVKFDLVGILNDTKSKVIQWSMKTNKYFVVQFHITTDKGKRVIEYYPKDTGRGITDHNWTTTSYIIHGIGSDATEGTWQTYTRNIESDLKRYESDNNLKAINDISFRGKARIDEIALYRDTKNLKIDKPVVVSAPGIVLTFDDSLTDNWDKNKDIFSSKDAVATFFCYRWGSNTDLTPPEIATYEAFEGDGHEIGYHTKDHLGTRDESYDGDEDKAQAYFDDQIKGGLAKMREEGFSPTSFSYPYISGQPEHNKLIRKELPHIREFFGHVVAIDNKDNKSIEEIKTLLDKYKKEKEIGVFLGHWILEDDNPLAKFPRTSKEKLIQLIDYAKKIGLRFYTLEEAHNIYLKQMKN